jgi:hypothetical protein
MLAQWNHDALAVQKLEIQAQRNRDPIPRPHDSITEQFLGASPTQNPRIYSESSPISYATADANNGERNKVRFLLINGGRDELVDPESQSGAFAAALTNAGFSVQNGWSLPKPAVSGCRTRSRRTLTVLAPWQRRLCCDFLMRGSEHWSPAAAEVRCRPALRI